MRRLLTGLALFLAAGGAVAQPVLDGPTEAPDQAASMAASNATYAQNPATVVEQASATQGVATRVCIPGSEPGGDPGAEPGGDQDCPPIPDLDPADLPPPTPAPEASDLPQDR